MEEIERDVQAVLGYFESMTMKDLSKTIPTHDETHVQQAVSRMIVRGQVEITQDMKLKLMS